jgi:hypothetical protein
MTRRRRLPLFLIGIGSLLAIVAILALWANRQLLDTDNWTETSSELLENEDIRCSSSTSCTRTSTCRRSSRRRYRRAHSRSQARWPAG